MDPVEVYPRIGRVVPEFAREQLRELVVDGYRIIYTIDAQTIWVAAVLHGNMDIAARLRDLAEGL
jgi:plasmid stabilization system protein ParE